MIKKIILKLQLDNLNNSIYVNYESVLIWIEVLIKDIIWTINILIKYNFMISDLTD